MKQYLNKQFLYPIAVGVITGGLMGLIGSHYATTANMYEMLEVYDQGKKDALKTNPPSMDLEITCANIWAGRVPPPDALK